MNLIGIGEIPCKLVKHLGLLSPESHVHEFLPHSSQVGWTMPQFEAYAAENDLSELISKDDETFCFIDGTASISGIVLPLLERLNQKPITIFYIHLTSQINKNHKICYNILREYARSGVFLHMFSFDYEKLFDAALDRSENTTINELNQNVIDKISFCVYSYYRLRTEKPIDGIFMDFDPTIYRISTFFEVTNDGKYAPYYDFSTERCFSFILFLPERLGKDDVLALKRVKNLIKNHTTKEQEAYFAVFTDDEQSLVGIASTNIV